MAGYLCHAGKKGAEKRTGDLHYKRETLEESRRINSSRILRVVSSNLRHDKSTRRYSKNSGYDNVSDPTCVGIGIFNSIKLEERTNFERTLSVTIPFRPL